MILPEPVCRAIWQEWKLHRRPGNRATRTQEQSDYRRNLSRSWRARNLGECSSLLHEERQNQAGIGQKAATSGRRQTSKQVNSLLKLVFLVPLYSKTFFFPQGSGFFMKGGIFIYMVHVHNAWYVEAVNYLLCYFYQSM